MNAPLRSRRRASRPLTLDHSPAPDEAARLALAELALSLAKAGGADYADIRLGATFQEYLRAREERLETARSGETWGFGLRVLRRGSWGFCGATSLTPDAVRRAVETALANARAVEQIQAQPIELEALPVVEDRWEMALGTDPFAVPIAKKADLLLAANAAARDAGADFCTSRFTAAREERLFANSRGSRIWQSRTRVWPEFEIAVVDKASGRFATRDSLIPPRGAGWEYIESCGFLDEARRGAQGSAPKASRQARHAGENAISSSSRAICS